jgi:hypothetical protein
MITFCLKVTFDRLSNASTMFAHATLSGGAEPTLTLQWSLFHDRQQQIHWVLLRMLENDLRTKTKECSRTTVSYCVTVFLVKDRPPPHNSYKITAIDFSTHILQA